MRVKMPKDLDNIQAKQIGPFTWRQLIGLGVGGATIYCIWAGLKNFISGDVCLILCIIAAIPFLAIGFLPKSIMQNLYAEQFAAMIIKYNILRPPVRKYKTVNTYDTLRNEILAEDKEKAQESQKKLSRKEKRERKKFNASVKGVR
jgi:hypothetical protein